MSLYPIRFCHNFIVFLLSLACAGSATAQQRSIGAAELAKNTPEKTEAKSAEPFDPYVQLALAMDGPLKGFEFNKSLATELPGDSVQLYTSGKEVRLVAWTESVGRRLVQVPIGIGEVNTLSVTGESLGKLVIDEAPAEIPLGREPIIYIPTKPNDLLLVAAAAERVEPRRQLAGPGKLNLTCTFRNPLEKPTALLLENGEALALRPGDSKIIQKTVTVGRLDRPQIFTIGASGIWQTVTVTATNPLSIDLWQEMPDAITVMVLNPSGEPVKAVAAVRLDNPENTGDPLVFPVQITEDQRVLTLALPLNEPGEPPYPISVELRLASGGVPLAQSPLLAQSRLTRFISIADFTKADERNRPMYYDVEKTGNGFAIASIAQPKEDPLPVTERGGCVLAAQFKAVGDSAWLKPNLQNLQSIIGKPRAFGVWIYGDGSGNRVSTMIRDGSGMSKTLGSTKLDFNGWRYQRWFFNESWQPPFTIEAILKAEYITGGRSSTTVFIHNPVLVYGFER